MYEVVFKRLGKALREIRKECRLTQEQLGELAQLSPKCIGEIERGETNPSLSIVLKLATALRVEPSQILNLDRRFFPKAVHMKKLELLLNDAAASHFTAAVESLINGKRA